MNILALDSQTWPKDISGHLVDDNQNHSEHYNPQRLDKKLSEKMYAIIEDFRDTFPNVKNHFYHR